MNIALLALLALVAYLILSPREEADATPRPVDEGTRLELQNLVRRGQSVEAIKTYRQRTGASLREAVRLVKQLE